MIMLHLAKEYHWWSDFFWNGTDLSGGYWLCKVLQTHSGGKGKRGFL